MSIIIHLYLYFYLQIEMIFVELVSLDLYDVRKHISYQQNQSFNLSPENFESFLQCLAIPYVTYVPE